MTDPPAYYPTGDRTNVETDRGSTTSTPRWMKVIGIGVILLVGLVVVLLFIGGSLGGHGPRMHN